MKVSENKTNCRISTHPSTLVSSVHFFKGGGNSRLSTHFIFRQLHFREESSFPLIRKMSIQNRRGFHKSIKLIALGGTKIIFTCWPDGRTSRRQFRARGPAGSTGRGPSPSWTRISLSRDQSSVHQTKLILNIGNLCSCTFIPGTVVENVLPLLEN